MLVTISDEHIEVGKARLMPTGSDAKNGIKRRDRVVNDDVKSLCLEVTLLLGQQEQRLRSFYRAIQRELDAGLRAGRRGGEPHKRR